MRGTSGTPRHTKRSRYRCSLPGLAGFAGLRRTEPEVPRIGSRSTRKRLPTQSSTAARAKKENHRSSKSDFCKECGQKAADPRVRPLKPECQPKILYGSRLHSLRKMSVPRPLGSTATLGCVGFAIVPVPGRMCDSLTRKALPRRMAVLRDFSKRRISDLNESGALK